MSKSKYQEIEVRFLEINKKYFIKKLKALGAEDFGEKLRHTLKLHDLTFDLDTWPNVPTYKKVE